MGPSCCTEDSEHTALTFGHPRGGVAKFLAESLLEALSLCGEGPTREALLVPQRFYSSVVLLLSSLSTRCKSVKGFSKETRN